MGCAVLIYLVSGVVFCRRWRAPTLASPSSLRSSDGFTTGTSRTPDRKRSNRSRIQVSTMYTCVTVFRTYRREAVIVTTTRLPVSLILSRVTVDNHTWPSVSLGLCSVVSSFSTKCLDVPPGVTGSDITHPLVQFPTLISI